jgi:hypothetical protein
MPGKHSPVFRPGLPGSDGFNLVADSNVLVTWNLANGCCLYQCFQSLVVQP